MYIVQAHQSNIVQQNNTLYRLCHSTCYNYLTFRSFFLFVTFSNGNKIKFSVFPDVTAASIAFLVDNDLRSNLCNNIKFVSVTWYRCECKRETQQPFVILEE